MIGEDTHHYTIEDCMPRILVVCFATYKHEIVYVFYFASLLAESLSAGRTDLPWKVGERDGVLYF